jgi:hypothetical protein
MLFATVTVLSVYLHLPPEVRALSFLAREVPRWSPANKCFSCHNNADAARALYLGRRLGYRVPTQGLRDTTAWLAEPARWEHNGGDQRFSDKNMAALHFADALAEALEAREVSDKKTLEQAADKIAVLQRGDGSWRFENQNSLGSPITYGPGLTAQTARQVLARSDPRKFATAIARAEKWLEQLPVSNAPDAAAVLLGLGDAPSPKARKQRERVLKFIRETEDRAGGWGPDSRSQAEVFDSAVVVIALRGMSTTRETADMIRRGRAYLIAQQQFDGGWPETTRPSGVSSYAHRISTSAWATRALLLTRPSN